MQSRSNHRKEQETAYIILLKNLKLLLSDENRWLREYSKENNIKINPVNNIGELDENIPMLGQQRSIEDGPMMKILT